MPRRGGINRARWHASASKSPRILQPMLQHSGWESSITHRLFRVFMYKYTVYVQVHLRVLYVSIYFQVYMSLLYACKQRTIALYILLRAQTIRMFVRALTRARNFDYKLCISLGSLLRLLNKFSCTSGHFLQNSRNKEWHPSMRISWMCLFVPSTAQNITLIPIVVWKQTCQS